MEKAQLIKIINQETHIVEGLTGLTGMHLQVYGLLAAKAVATGQPLAAPANFPKVMSERQKEYLRLLRKHYGVQVKAQREMDISAPTVYYWQRKNETFAKAHDEIIIQTASLRAMNRRGMVATGAYGGSDALSVGLLPVDSVTEEPPFSDDATDDDKDATTATVSQHEGYLG